MQYPANETNPSPADEAQRILKSLRFFYVTVGGYGSREDFLKDLEKISDPTLDYVTALHEMVIGEEEKLLSLSEGSFDKAARSTIQAMTMYASLACCLEATRPELSATQQWWWLGRAYDYLGRLRGTVFGEIIGERSSVIGRAKNGAAARHKENREMKEEVFQWLSENMARYTSLDSAAEAIAGDVVPIKFRTARNWVGQWKKSRSTEKE